MEIFRKSGNSCPNFPKIFGFFSPIFSPRNFLEFPLRIWMEIPKKSPKSPIFFPPNPRIFPLILIGEKKNNLELEKNQNNPNKFHYFFFLNVIFYSISPPAAELGFFFFPGEFSFIFFFCKKSGKFEFPTPKSFNWFLFLKLGRFWGRKKKKRGKKFEFFRVVAAAGGEKNGFKKI